MKECRNCKHGEDGLIYIFCKEPHRMQHHPRLYRENKVPRGGFPQSYNHWCAMWEAKEE